SAKPLFPFGHGLSFTRFEYAGLEISPAQVRATEDVRIRFSVTNSGDRSGDEVVQLYVHDLVASVTRPVKELKGFQRISLDRGQKKTVTFVLSTSQLGFYDRGMKFVVEPGTIEVMVGSSSDDIRATGAFEVVGPTTVVPAFMTFTTQTSIE